MACIVLCNPWCGFQGYALCQLALCFLCAIFIYGLKQAEERPYLRIGD